MNMLFMPGFTQADIFFAFQESNPSGKLIVLLLFVGSVFAWSIMVGKFMELRRANRATRRFMLAYRKEKHPLSLFVRRQKYEGSPLYEIYERGCVALGAELEDRGINATELFMGGVGEERHISEIQMEAVRNVNERNVADQAVLLEGSMGLLATAVSASPFLGLLGTVWGVMDSFGGMAVSGSATLAAVAPGISGALLTTVVGLLVALPSAIGYNLLTNSIRRLTVQMDNFAQEFSADVQRTFCAERR